MDALFGESPSKAKESGKPVIIDFYADWCSPCRHMDRTTFHDRSIIEAAAKDFVTIRADFSKRGDPARERLARSYGVRGMQCHFSEARG